MLELNMMTGSIQGGVWLHSNSCYIVTHAQPMGSTVFRNPQALSSALAALGLLQPRAFGFLNTVDPLVSVSNYYLCVCEHIYNTESSKGQSPETNGHNFMSCDIICNFDCIPTHSTKMTHVKMMVKTCFTGVGLLVIEQKGHIHTQLLGFLL